MSLPPLPPQGEAPSARRLLRSTVIALTVAGVLLVTTVLPAEYGIDPTGVGNVLGLKAMGEIKIKLAQENQAAEDAAASGGVVALGTPAADVTINMADQGVAADTSATAQLVLAPGQGKEIKLVMKGGAQASYSWTTDRGVVGFELHGDSANAPANSFISYKKGSQISADSGVFTAAFDGFHGWYWRNRTAEAVTITLKARGAFSEMKLPK